MKVYIAAVFASKKTVAQRSEELIALGILPTNRWHNEAAPHNSTINDFPDEYFRETAVFDIEDILAADTMILTVPSELEMADMTIRSLSRGGRHFETGMMYGLMMSEPSSGRHLKLRREIIILGKRENVFHFLDGQSVTSHYPLIKQFDTWEQVKEYLVERAKSEIGCTQQKPTWMSEK